MTELLDRLRAVLDREPDVAYAVRFGSAARNALRPDSDVDIAIEFRPAVRPVQEAVGSLTAGLESAAERTVHLLCIEDAAAPLAYRVFRQGCVIVEYLDFKPVVRKRAHR